MDSLRETKTDGSGFQLIATRDEFNDMDDDFGAGYKNCTKCSILKPLDEFWVEPKGVMGRKSWCKACSGTKKKKVNRRDDGIIERAAVTAWKELIVERYL